MLSTLRRDIAAALKNDPAARSVKEVLLAYPGVHALAIHRVAHGLWERGHKLSARLVAHQARFLTGVEIHPGAQISGGVFIDHGMGVVIGETAVVEEGCIIYKGVVLGGTSLERKVRHPHLAKNVIIGSNACVLGAIHVGEGARIGSGSVVIADVPAGATVVGIPGRVVRGVTPHDVLDHASLPDPVMEVLRGLAAQQEALVERLSRLEGETHAEKHEDDSPRAKVGRIF
ncbi:MAG: serine O-acetyltransferase [Myxococcaceae bacterium]